MAASEDENDDNEGSEEEDSQSQEEEGSLEFGSETEEVVNSTITIGTHSISSRILAPIFFPILWLHEIHNPNSCIHISITTFVYNIN